jgi:cysteinyl-tRNA synthetase
MEGLRGAASSIERLRNFHFRLTNGSFPDGTNEGIASRTEAFPKAFQSALDDDLNTAQATALLFELVREANSAIDAGEFRKGNVAPVLACIGQWDGIFDVLDPAADTPEASPAGLSGLSDDAIRAKIADREQARKQRDFALADQIRQELSAAGILLEDTKEGVRWRRK